MIAMSSSNPGTPHRGPENCCFGCGSESGLRLDFRREDEAAALVVLARCRVPERFAGPPTLVHGGIIATLLDEAMSKIVAHLGRIAFTRELAVDYRRPVPAEAPLVVEGRLEGQEGGEIRTAAEIRDEGDRVLATGRACFAVLDESQARWLGRRLASRRDEQAGP
jgi:uncharacterized protein (TIGR00369 family)